MSLGALTRIVLLVRHFARSVQFFLVANADTARRELEARGIAVEPIHEPGPGLRVAEFRDPDGRRIAIEERRTS